MQVDDAGMCHRIVHTCTIAHSHVHDDGRSPPAHDVNNMTCSLSCIAIQKLVVPRSAPFHISSFVTQNPKVTADRAFNGYGTNFENSPEPIYGNLFLPRKFKVAVTVPGDNSVDLFTNDVGLVVITSPSGELEGFDVVVGGGMGRTHRNESTFARLADAIGFVPKEDIFHAMKAIVATQRDYGRRDDRKQSRLKYLVQEWGIDKFRSVVEQYYGKRFQPFRSVHALSMLEHLVGALAEVAANVQLNTMHVIKSNVLYVMPIFAHATHLQQHCYPSPHFTCRWHQHTHRTAFNCRFIVPGSSPVLTPQFSHVCHGCF